MALPSNIADPSHISELISNLIINRNRIRDKLYNPQNWDITEAAGETLEGLADILENISTHKNIDVDLREGDSYNIPKGYHDGSGVVTGVAGGGNYTLQAKTVSAGRSDITVVPDQGKYGLSSVKVNAIPSNLQDVSLVTAAAGDVLVGKTIVSSTGTITAGTMVNNGAVSQTLSTSVTEYTVPVGYHNGSGKVSVKLEEKSITPAATSQTVVPTTGSLLSKVTVNAIPAPYYDVSGVDAVASNVFTGKKFVNSSGVLTTGTMTNRGAVAQTLSTTTTQYTVTQGYHNGSGTVKIVLEDKAITPAAAAQTVYPTAGKVFNKITVNAIPAPYYNVSGVTAVASHVLTGDKFVNSSGTTVTGTMTDNSAVAETLDILNTTYTVPTGYHNGSGIVGIVPETQTATPSTSSQTITATNGKVLAAVTVNAIPSQYKDISNVTATAAAVLSGRTFVNSTGTVTGTMANNSAVNQTLSTTSTQYTVPPGYHNGAGTVKIVTEDKTLTPAAAAQTVYATAGKVINKVTVNAIPAPYYNTSGVTAVASHVLANEVFVDSSGAAVTGTMTNRGSGGRTLYMDSTTAQQSISSGFYDGTGKISVAYTTRTVTPTKASQNIIGDGVASSNIPYLAAVTVNAIPSEYQNVTTVTAVASHVLTGDKFVSSIGTTITGTMANNGAVNQTLTTASTQYTVPTGFHSGSGTVKIVLETKSATPTTSAQTITPTTGKVLSSVSVAAIPSQYKDTTGADAVAANVLSGKKFVNTTGTVTGTMANNGTVTQTLSTTSTQYTIPEGYHSGTGVVKIVTETKNASPTTVTQTITASAGKVLDKVNIGVIPPQYGDTSTDNAGPQHLLSGRKAHSISGNAAVQITGTMANNGSYTSSVDGLTIASQLIPQGYHDGTGFIYLTNDIEIALASI